MLQSCTLSAVKSLLCWTAGRFLRKPDIQWAVWSKPCSCTNIIHQITESLWLTSSRPTFTIKCSTNSYRNQTPTWKDNWKYRWWSIEAKLLLRIKALASYFKLFLKMDKFRTGLGSILNIHIGLVLKKEKKAESNFLKSILYNDIRQKQQDADRNMILNELQSVRDETK